MGGGGRFFEGELLDALRDFAGRRYHADADAGHWAGAMGHTQFMPSSLPALCRRFHRRRQAVTVWGDDPRDALASDPRRISSTLAGILGQPWALKLQLPDGFDYLLRARYF